MSGWREELDRRLRSLAFSTYFASEAEQSDDLRRRADVLMAALEAEFCEEVAPRAGTYAHSMSEGFGAKKNREGDRMLRAVQGRLDDLEWRRDYEKGYGTAAKERRLAQRIAQELFLVLQDCPLAKEVLPLLQPGEQVFFPRGRVQGRLDIYQAGRGDENDLLPTKRMAKAIAETLGDNKFEAKPIVVASLKSLGCDDDVARGFVRKKS